MAGAMALEPTDATARPPAAALAGGALLVAFFGALLGLHAAEPAALVFDEVHYVPAAQALARLAGDLNWEHPPLSKWILGVGARLLVGSGLVGGEITAMRLVTAAFALWALLSVAGMVRDLGLGEGAAQLAAWLTGFNVLWFVQGRTAMPDTFYVAFALAGVRLVRRGAGGPGPWIGWALLGLAMACKWAAAPLCLVGFLLAPQTLARRVAGVGLAVAAYLVPFLPLALLARDATPVTGLLHYQVRMLRGFGAVNLATHPYASHPWQWPTLLRPAWYHFESGAGGERYVWAGGNPLLFAVALPATLGLGVAALRRGAAAADRTLALLYWAPLLFWVALGRTGVFYYFLAASLWLGPAVAWSALRLLPRRRALAVLGALTVACGALFLWFTPVLDGRREPPGTYHRYMWTDRWR
jgi:dolichyl-phosphate-mannose--protein O-mannosyl transferase